ncbi:MAG: ATP-binding protein [Novosphingobium sp.]
MSAGQYGFRNACSKRRCDLLERFPQRLNRWGFRFRRISDSESKLVKVRIPAPRRQSRRRRLSGITRSLDRSLFLKLGSCDWVRSRRNLLITGPCGVGKSYLACALGHKACREDLPVAYYRASQLFAMLALGRGDGRYARMLQRALSRARIFAHTNPSPSTSKSPLILTR